MQAKRRDARTEQGQGEEKPARRRGYDLGGNEQNGEHRNILFRMGLSSRRGEHFLKYKGPRGSRGDSERAYMKQHQVI